MFRIKTREVTGVTEVTDGCGLLPRDEKKLPREGDFGVGLPGYRGYPGYPTCFCFRVVGYI